jgi:glycine/D-amino acid oxidase-like deaminating enzyme
MGDEPGVPPPSCDVLIVGAGITGALLADSLAAAGVAVTVLDRRPEAAGSTAACTGIVTYEADVEFGRLIDQVGEERAARSYRACVRGVELVAALAGTFPDACGFAWTPSVYLGTKRRDRARLESEVRLREAHGLEAAFLDPDAVQAVYGWRSTGAVVTTRSAVIDPVRFARQLLDRAKQAGAAVCTGITVLDWTATASGASVSTSAGTLEAGHVIFATGYETPPAFRDDLVSLHSSFAIATPPLPSGARNLEQVVWTTDRPYLYARPAEGNRTVIGGRDLAFQNAHLRDGLLPRRARSLERALDAFLPDTAPAQAEFEWAGTFGVTSDGLPYIGARSDAPRALFALGYGGNGIVFSAIAAEVLRDVVVGMGHEYLDLFAFDRS